MTDAGEVRRRTGGRSARVVAAIHHAVNDLVAHESPRGITVAEIAERAGVNPTSIYRRWGTLEALVLDVEAARLPPIPDTGNLRGDLLAYAATAAREVARPGGLAFLQAVMGLTEVSERRRSAPLRERGARIQAMLDRARDRGETALDQGDVYDCILAPIYFRAISGVGGLTKARLAVFVDRALARSPESQ